METKQLMMNDHLRYTMEENASPFLIFDPHHYIDFYLFLSQNIPPVLVLFIIGIFSSLFIKKNSLRNLKLPSLALGFLTVFIIHSSFFSLYPMRVDRNTYFSLLALILTSSSIIATQFKKWNLKPFLIMPITVFLMYNHFQQIHSPKFILRLHKNTFPFIIELKDYLHEQKSKNKNVHISYSWPFTIMFGNPHMGYTKEPIHIPTINDDNKENNFPDIIIVHQNYASHPENEILKEIIANNPSKYFITKSFSLDHVKTKIDVYKKRSSSRPQLSTPN